MADTKENILTTALRLFAQDGYEAVSVSKIAGQLGMTKGALYKHYKSKRHIFDCIFAHLSQLDQARFEAAGVAKQGFDPQLSSATVSIEGIQAYMKSQFSYWTRDELACNFRKMLTLEQYRSPEMTALYQKVMASGPVGFLASLFCTLQQQGALCSGCPTQLATVFFAPFHLLLSMSDGMTDRAEQERFATLFLTHMEDFFARYAVK